MALELHAYIKLSPNELYIHESTGIYSLEDNATGWGAPNKVYGDITTIELKITNTLTNQIVEYDVEFPDTPVNEIVWGPFENVFSDGILKLEYKITFSDESELEFCSNVFFMLEADCCLDNLALTYLEEDRLKYFEYSKILLEANAIRNALRYSALSLNETRVKYYLNKLNTFCQKCATVK